MNVKVIRMDSSFETSIWTFRPWRYPISQDLSEWTIRDEDSEEVLTRRIFRAMDTWKFWSPFFESRGYKLYTRRGRGSRLIPPATPLSGLEQEYPFARLLGTPEDFEYPAMGVWPARDQLGRDVIIKLVSTGGIAALEQRIATLRSTK